MPRLRLAVLLVAVLFAPPSLAQDCQDAVRQIEALLDGPIAGTGPAGQEGETATEQPQYGNPEGQAEAEVDGDSASPTQTEGDVAEEQPQQGSEDDTAAATAAPSLEPGETATEQPQFGSAQEPAADDGSPDRHQRLTELRDQAQRLAEEGRDDECQALAREAESLAQR